MARIHGKDAPDIPAIQAQLFHDGDRGFIDEATDPNGKESFDGPDRIKTKFIRMKVRKMKSMWKKTVDLVVMKLVLCSIPKHSFINSQIHSISGYLIITAHSKQTEEEEDFSYKQG